MKITTEDCIDAIVKKLGNTSTKDWKRLSKKGTRDNIIRVFKNRITGVEISVRSSESEIFDIYIDESNPIQTFGNIKNYLKERVKELYDEGESFHQLNYELFYEIKNWPQVREPDGDPEDTEPLDMENFEWLSITDDKVVIICGGDWQDPLKVTIRLNADNELTVTSYSKVGNNWKDGFDEDEFNEKLGINDDDDDDNKIKRFRNF